MKPAREALRQGVLPRLIGYRLRLAQQAVFRDFAVSVGELSPGRVGMLLLIEANPGVPQGRLAEAVSLDRSTMVGVVDSLEERGLIERRRGIDRRTNGLWLTREGRSLAARLRRRIERHEQRVAERLTTTERAQLLALLEKLSQ
ncbi:MAG TPA: MarR family transcriptional regulator [Burkholderiales bacterium]|nr:MarR family transcriptional regulator [Burkholderiales bacterium]